VYKICVVGLGGSGGKTLQFLMDQLKSELAAVGWTADHLPHCWEFVHIDVPPAPDGVGPGLPPTVPAQGGTYIPVSSQHDQYSVLDAALQTSLTTQPNGSQLRQLVQWRPLASRVVAPITLGAGQYRAVGRLVTLARAGLIYDRLVPVAERLNQSQADSDLAAVADGLGLNVGPSQGSIVLVVSSLAGGTGASMTLDVCNLLRAVASQVPNFRAESLAYLYTPDVFDKLDAGQRTGVNANALGTVSELMSAMAGKQTPWTPEEWSVYGGVPRPTAPGRGPMLTFPVGSFNGISGARFGDGKPDTIYRGLARALTTLFLSEAQQNQLMAYAVGNLGAIAGSVPDATELSVQPARSLSEPESIEPLVFGSLGFASVGLGRDRYAEYAAQRLARLGVDRLRLGHVDLSVQEGHRSPQQAIASAASLVYPDFLGWAGLPDVRSVTGSVLKALVHDVWSADARDALSARLTDETISPALQPGITGKGSYFAQQLGGLLTAAFSRVRDSADSELRDAAGRWVPSIQARLETAVLQVAGERGIPVADRVLQMFASDLQHAAESLVRGASMAPDAQAIAQDVTGELQTVTSTIDARHGVLTQATNRVRNHFSDLFLRRGSALVGELLVQLNADLVTPLRTGLGNCLAALDSAAAITPGNAPVATVATTLVQQWPAGEDVPSRFATAQNEVLLEDIAGYPKAYAGHLVQTFSGYTSGGSAPSAERGQELAVTESLTWLHAGARGAGASADQLPGFESDGSPRRIGRRSEWWPQALPGPSTARPARYEVALDHVSVLQGARGWVGRRGEVMGLFVGEGLDVYLNRPGASSHERTETARRFVDRFRAALQLAAPLVAVDAKLVAAVHQRPVSVGYQFSELPFRDSPDVAGMLVDALEADQSIEPRTVERFQQAVTSAGRNRIDILGTYADLYSPVVFSSLQAPIRKQWTDSTSAQLRRAFWSMRRGRPLVDFVPVSRGWLQSMITGWVVGRLTGEVLLPGEGPVSEGGIAVWSPDARAFTRLPHPLLGGDDLARGAQGWGLVAAVAESLPLAIALCDGDPQLTALQPYRSLFELGRRLQDVEDPRPSEALLPWVLTGTGRSGVLPRGAATAPAGDREDRLAAGRTWASALQTAATKLLPRDPAHPGDRGEYSEITPHNFRNVPREWEIAPQLVTAGAQLLRDLELPDYAGAGETVIQSELDGVEF
jgi:hypothetical protein